MLSIIRKSTPWLAGLCVLMFLLSWSFKPVGFYLQMHSFMDDSFFYYTVGRNVAIGLGSSFDGINQTNGYQPLWQLFCIFFAFLTRNRQTYIEIVNVTQAICASVMAIFIAKHWIQRCALSPLTLLPLSFFFLYGPFFAHFTNGLETALGMALISISGYLLCETDRKHTLPAKTLGAVCGLAFLARTDTIFLGICVCLFVFFRSEGPARIKRLLECASCYSLFLIPYFLINIFIFHTVFPISGMVKQVWAHLMFELEEPLGRSFLYRKLELLSWPLDQPDYYPIGIVVVTNLFCLLLLAGMRRWGACVLASFSVIKYIVYILLFHTYSRFQWYYAPDYVIALFLLPQIVATALKGKITSHIQEIFFGATSLAIFIGVLLSGWVTHSPYSALVSLNHHQNLLTQKVTPYNELQFYQLAAQMINRMPLPPRAVLSAHNSGVLGFFSDHRVVNMDGLINGLTRLDYIKKYGWDFLHYLDSQNYIGGYVDCVAEPGYQNYHRAFVQERGFIEVDLRKLINDRFGYSNTNSLVLFLKPNMVEQLKKDKKFGPYVLAPGESRS